MAIYSLRLSSVGKTTQKQPFTAAAHLKYITRKEAVTHVMAARMPDVRRQVIAWLRHEERDDRKNARVIDKVVLALPRELSAVHQQALVKAFAEGLTQGRASWFAAFHTKGKDRDNPHCHLVLRDRDAETGRRVMFLSAGKKEAAERRDKGQAAPTTLTTVRALWERCANAALQVAGLVVRIDRRTLAAQGIARKPQVHEGPNIRSMHKRGFRPRSRDRVARVRVGRRQGGATRVVRWAEIDRGQTRVEYNASLRAEARTSAVAVERASRPVEGRMAAVVAAPSTALSRTEAPTPGREMSPERKSAAGIGPAVSPSHAPSSPPPLPPPIRPEVRELSLTELFAQETGAAVARPPDKSDRSRGR